MTWQGADRTKVDQTAPRLGRLTLGGFDASLLLIGERGWVALGNNRRRLEGDGLAFYQNFHAATV